MKERPLLDWIMLEITRLGGRVFRNNVGLTKQGERKIRYGLGKGSSDLIGWLPVKITKEMVGLEVAIFLAIEAKTKGVVLSDEQEVFLDVVSRNGGIALEVKQLGELTKGRVRHGKKKRTD